MKDRDIIADSLRNAYKKHSKSGDPDKNIDYITNMLMLEVLCDIRDMLSDIRDSRKIIHTTKRPLH